ncbi:unnamed protein product, partial [Iphiclides podalirius]
MSEVDSGACLVILSANRGEDARAALPHQQMKSGTPHYPVDRYLVESSNRIEMVNIDDETWKSEPAIRPEDEAVLRTLREMLQSTADELRLISGELKREPRVRFGATPTLDQEFNERLHVEEIVDAKFHGCRIVRPPHTRTEDIREVNARPTKPSATANASVQVNRTPAAKKATKSLSMSRTRIVQIDEPRVESERPDPRKPFVYNEYSYKHEETKVKDVRSKPLNVQAMPSINIRGELKEQKVLQLDIIPEQKTDTEKLPTQSNVAVIAIQHEPTPAVEKTISKYPEIRYVPTASPKPAFRRVSKMLTCDSSESTDNVTSKTRMKSRNLIKAHVKSIPKASARFEKYKESNNRSKLDKKQNSNIDDWRRKINTIYGRLSTSRNIYARSQPASRVSTKSDPVPTSSRNKSQTLLNNAEYIPYSKLTLGGVNVSDIEREISDLTDKNVPLSPILDKILISRENSFHDSAPKKDNANKNILTTSDENLLEEVLDIERNITTTLNKNLNGKDKVISAVSSESNQSGRSYADDFEEERSDNDKTQSDEAHPNRNVTTKDGTVIHIESGIKDATYTKSPNLSFKSRVDIFEFIHSINTQDNATQSNCSGKITPKSTQSNCSGKITPKSTQTSPRNVPIRNDLWLEAHASTNPTSDVDKINEEFIKKLIIDECTGILQKNIAKTKETSEKRNSTASQKNTQTSPAHVRGVMTSPTKTKTRTTSPLGPLTVDHQTSPVAFAPSEETHIALGTVDDLAASINLSSPRFSLRLPKDSRDVISNLDAATSRDRKPFRTPLPLKTFTSSSSADADYSSDVSSFGEINDRLRRRPRRNKILTVSESSTSTSKCSSDSSVVLPLRSEGEISLGQVDRKTGFSRSEGEMSLGLR